MDKGYNQIKWLFEKWQDPLLKLANNFVGRRFLQIDDDLDSKKIIKIFPNGVCWWTGRTKKVNGKWHLELKYRFRCYPLYAKRIIGALASLEILRTMPSRNYNLYRGLNSYQGLLNYTGLLRNRQFPTILLQTNYYTGAGDGHVRHRPTSTTWADTRSATDGTSVDYTGTTTRVLVAKAAANDFSIYRVFMPVDTSGITDTDNIDAVDLKVYFLNQLTTAHNVAIVQSSQSSTSSLITDDFDQCGALDNPDEGATRIAFNDMTNNAYNTFTFNATGRGWISKTGFSKIGMREGSKDIDNVEPTDNVDGNDFSTSEETGTSQDPYLAVTTSAAAGAIMDLTSKYW